jgi:Zn-finger nucleic acid-binding protein
MSFPETFETTCPACKKEDVVDVMEDRGVEFLGCSECFGLFVSEDGLQAYIADSTGSSEIGKAFVDLMEKALGDKPPRPGSRGCPVCKKPLGRLGFGESPFVILDRCGLHGVWLDKKELKKVIRSVRAHAAVMGLAPAFDEEDDDGTED